ncbi:hypothetical protein TorRG33x02_012890 [Trema orientale]|uniref:Uncharacterized protein n=1 Tax=Trema orientale TaxID=63057 RepID=A0A2P5FZJ7_TREOI|nr:hypothetical protein TorRG33x02_012890 [Trema orientale]
MAIQDVIHFISHSQTTYELELFLCIMWSIWGERNKQLFQGKHQPAAATLAWINAYLQSYRDVNLHSYPTMHPPVVKREYK